MEPPTNYNISCRRSSQVRSYRPGVKPFKLLAFGLGRQLSVGILSRPLEKAQVISLDIGLGRQRSTKRR